MTYRQPEPPPTDFIIFEPAPAADRCWWCEEPLGDEEVAEVVNIRDGRTHEICHAQCAIDYATRHGLTVDRILA